MNRKVIPAARLGSARQGRQGFTLIELLVAMTIIAILSGLALVSYQGARKTARDGKRKVDLEQIRSALEMCYADENEYPSSIDSGVSCGGKDYLVPLPVDPATSDEYYYDGSAGTSYILCATLEASSPHDCGANGNYKVTNP